jgi:sodium transport system permease protein
MNSAGKSTSETTPEEDGAASALGSPQPRHRKWLGRLRRLMLKELRETLRDRRTIITLVVMPTLIYPLLALAFQRFLLTAVSVTQDVHYDIGVAPASAGKILFKQLVAGSKQLAAAHRIEQSRESLDVGPASAEERARSDAAHGLHSGGAKTGDSSPEWNLYPMSAKDAVRHIGDSTLHIAVLSRDNMDSEPDKGLETPRTWELVYPAGSPMSEAALHFVESRLSAVNASALDTQLKQLGVTAVLEAPTVRRAIEFTGAPIFSLAALIPLVLVLMTVTGAVYPAIDLTAGERERGTLEMLIAAPVPRIGLLLAKYAAVLTVALLTALANLAAMTITVHSTGLASSLFGAGGLSLVVVGKVLLLLALFAAFFSALLLALTSYARSFKEAQAYIIPLMLLCLVPGVLCLMPSLQFSGWMAVTPLVNILMLARDLLEGSVEPGLTAAAVLSTAFYVAAAIALAARIFGTDAILYGSQSTWSDIFRRPAEPQRSASVPAAMFCLALMFPTYFLLANGLAHSRDASLGSRLVAASAITAVVFAVIPLAVAVFGRVHWSSGVGMAKARPLQLLAAGFLGLVLWPIAHEIYLASAGIGLSSLGEDQLQRAKQLLDELQGMPFWAILLALAVVPAVCEEVFFRGFLFSALRSAISSWQTIAATAILFGLFHEVLGPGRFLASAFLGLVLGWVRLRTRSVWPCMVLHMLHNGLLLAISYWRPALEARGWGVAEQSHLPVAWLALAATGICVAGAMLVLSTRLNIASVSERPSTDSAASRY